jgi:hypothetical protein
MTTGSQALQRQDCRLLQPNSVSDDERECFPMSAGIGRAGWIRKALRKREHVMNWLALLALLSLGFLWHSDPLDVPAAQNARGAQPATYASVTPPSAPRVR